MEISKKEILEQRKLLNEDGWENALMVAGFIPVIGEIADIALIGLYLYRKEYIYAGLMLIALIPTVGDFIAKPFITLLKGYGAVGKTALKSADDMAKFLMENPKAKANFLKMSEHFDNKLVQETIKRLNKTGTGLGQGLTQSMNTLKSVVGKLKPVRLGQRVGQEIASQSVPGFFKTIVGGGPVAMGIKGFFREERLAKYIAKTGKKPSNWLSYWYNIIRGGRSDRRKMVKSLIIASGILSFFGLPSFESFEQKFMEDENFRNQLANNPEFSSIVNYSGVSPQELSSIESSGEKSGGGMGAFMNLAVLKTLARLYA